MLENAQLCHGRTLNDSLGNSSPQLLVTLCAGFDLKRSAKDLGEAGYLQSAGELSATRCASLVSVFSLGTLGSRLRIRRRSLRT